MDSERYQRVKSLFFEASRRSVAERSSYLAIACAEDPSLGQEVETLLAAGAQSRGFLESPAIDGDGFRALVDESLAMPAAEEVPERIGKYRVIRCIGEGGMGRVYEAEQDSPRRRVALKVIRAAISTRRALQRFEQEVEILGRLRHPGIAQIHEAGVAEVQAAGGASATLPFYAMEYIDGTTLMHFARSHNLSTTARIELVARICEAVHFGHQRGIIHRDLKPSNILVEAGRDGEAQPKVIDFGVARMMDHNPELTVSQTHAGQVVGTIAYMSPEQLGGDPGAVDTRSDVYSMGVITFELLTGELPFDLGGKAMHEAALVIRDQEPRRLSSLDPVLRGDIETIVAKALSKEPSCRYQSASELGADLRRLLRSEPIVARPPTLGYQLARFALRHKELVAGVAAAFLLLVAGVMGTSLGWMRARTGETQTRPDATVQRSLPAAAAGTRAPLSPSDKLSGAPKPRHGAGLQLPYFAEVQSDGDHLFMLANTGMAGAIFCDGGAFGVMGRGYGPTAAGVIGEHPSTGNSGKVGAPVAGLYGAAASLGNNAGVYGVHMVTGASGKLGQGVPGESPVGIGVEGEGDVGGLFSSSLTAVQALSDSGTAVKASAPHGTAIHAVTESGLAGSFEGSTYFSSNMGLGVAAPSFPIHHSSGACLTAAGQWTNACDRNKKDHFEPIDPVSVLERVASLPIQGWAYKAEEGVRHIGPTAQDFHAAFGLGDSEVSIGTVDADGVALAAIQGLHRLLEEKDRAISDLRDANVRLERRLEALEQAIGSAAWLARSPGR